MNVKQLPFFSRKTWCSSLEGQTTTSLTNCRHQFPSLSRSRGHNSLGCCDGTHLFSETSIFPFVSLVVSLHDRSRLKCQGGSSLEAGSENKWALKKRMNGRNFGRENRESFQIEKFGSLLGFRADNFEPESNQLYQRSTYSFTQKQQTYFTLH